jgi:hypothetical protein
MNISKTIAAIIALFAGITASAQEMLSKQQLDELRERAQQEIMLEDLRDCKPVTMSRCWYMFHAAGEKPRQRVWYLDLKVRTPENGIAEIDIVEAHETDDPSVQGANNFVFYTLQFRCERQRMRVLDGYAYMFGNRVDRAPGAGEWLGDYQNSWFGEAGRVACDKRMQLTPQAMKLMWLGDYYRPIDLVDFTRRFLWEQNTTAQ